MLVRIEVYLRSTYYAGLVILVLLEMVVATANTNSTSKLHVNSVVRCDDRLILEADVMSFAWTC